MFPHLASKCVASNKTALTLNSHFNNTKIEISIDTGKQIRTRATHLAPMSDWQTQACLSAGTPLTYGAVQAFTTVRNQLREVTCGSNVLQSFLRNPLIFLRRCMRANTQLASLHCEKIL